MTLFVPDRSELAAHTLEGRHTLSQINLNLYHRAGTPVPRIPDDLAGKALILIGGYSYWPNINAILENPALDLRLLRTSNHLSALEMLRRKRGDYLLDYQAPVEQVRKELGLSALPYTVLQSMQLRLIASRHAEGSRRLLDELDRAYEELQAAGEPLQLD